VHAPDHAVVDLHHARNAERLRKKAADGGQAMGGNSLTLGCHPIPAKAVNIVCHAGGHELLLCRQYLPEPSANES
jgi:hypothetical protein